MSELFKPVVTLWEKLSKGKIELPAVASLAPEKCTPAGKAGSPIRRNKMYFTLRINEMYLAENRQWWATYDPMVVVVCEFNYGQERVAVPKVIGPNLIQKYSGGDRASHGVVLQNTRVTGPHPYRGGDIDISVALYRVERKNYAHVLLKVVDTLSSSLGDPGQMQAIAKTAGALLDGVEGLIGMSETVYLAGLRMSLSDSVLEPLSARYSALMTPNVPEISDLSVVDDRLYVKSNNSVRPYQNSDFVLLSITGSEERGDESGLPFFQLKSDAINALWEGRDKAADDRAKSNLIAAYQQMRKSPDMTESEAERLFESWLVEFKDTRRKVHKVKSLSLPIEERHVEISPLAGQLNNVALLVDGLPWPPPDNGPDH